MSLAFVVASATVYGALPFVRMREARTAAMECLARYDAPRGPKLPDCSASIQEFSKLAKVSYVHHDATYRAEELWARIMVAEYENASVGAPDAKLREDTAKFVDEAETVIDKGSQRIQLDELGQVIAAPHLGKLAASLGDRPTLIAHFDWWTQWPVRVHAMRAALLEGDLAKAGAMAARYYDWGPRDPDLRTMMGAILCLGSDPQKGLDLLTRVPGDRAEKRYAAIARNYGEVLGVMKACAKKAKLDLPPLPDVSHAGVADFEEARIVEDIRLSTEPAQIHEASDKAVTSLQEKHGLVHAPRSTRAMLVAAVAAQDDRFGDERGPLGASVIGAFVAAKDVEGNDAPIEPFELSLQVLLGGTASSGYPETSPVLSEALLDRAETKLVQLAARPTKSKDEDERALLIRRGAATLALHAAMASARNGDVDRALLHVDEAGRLGVLSPRRSALNAAGVAFLAGDERQALARLVGDEGDDVATEASIALIASLAHAALGEREPARADVARALLLATKLGDPELLLDARWLDLALSDATPAGAPLETPVYTGMADPLARWKTMGAPDLTALLASWRGAFSANDEQRLAFRYASMRFRGDAPPFAVSYMAAGARLAPSAAQGQRVEVWLDALTAIDLPRMPVSSYAWSRRQAARMRGDTESAELWQKRLVSVRAMRSGDADLEIARFIGL